MARSRGMYHWAILACLSTIPTGAMAQRSESITLQTSELKIDRANPAIDLTVSASVLSAPDAASFSTGVETSAAKAKDAIAKNAEKMAAVVAQLKAAGIDAKDIQTSAISLGRDYGYLANGKQRFKGYRVSNRVNAKLRDMTRLGDLLDALTVSGATEFNGPSFKLDNSSIAEASARDRAWASAYETARYHAKKAGFDGVVVVRVAERVEQSAQRSSAAFGVAEEAVDAARTISQTPLEGGEIEIAVTLAISFQMVK